VVHPSYLSPLPQFRVKPLQIESVDIIELPNGHLTSGDCNIAIEGIQALGAFCPKEALPSGAESFPCSTALMPDRRKDTMGVKGFTRAKCFLTA
jgi:hypothetical protein